MHEVDVLIIGNGVLGLSTAFFLLTQEPNLKVAVLGPHKRSGAATVAAGAMLGCFGEVTEGNLSSDAGKIKHKVCYEAAKAWPRWVQHINKKLDAQHAVSIEKGTYVIVNTISGNLDDENYLAMIRSLQEYKEPYETLEPADIPGMDPIENCRAERAIYIPNEGTINPYQLLESLQAIVVQSKHGELIDDTVTQLHLSGDKINYVETKSGKKIVAKKILIATGSFTQKLLDQIPALKNRIPKVISGVGISLLVEQCRLPIPKLIRSVNRAGACGLHVLPRNNQLYVGATNNLSLTPLTAPRMGYMHFLIQCAIEQINQTIHSSKIISWTVGNRPVTLDTFPLIGATSIPNLWILAGTYRDGLHYSPISSQIIAAQMLGKKSEYEPLVDLFKPERLPIQSMTRAEAINEAVLHYTSGAYEHGMKLPRIGWDHVFSEMIRTKIENLMDELDTDYVVTPDILLLLDENKELHLNYLKDYFQNCWK